MTTKNTITMIVPEMKITICLEKTSVMKTGNAREHELAANGHGAKV